MTEVPTPDSQKRKLGESAYLGAEPKRHKDNDALSDTASVAATDGSVDADGDVDVDDRDSASDTPTANPAHTIEGPGPYVFFCWADAIFSILGESPDDEDGYFTLKAAALEAWNHVAHLPKEDRFEALEDHIHMVRKWYVSVDEKVRGAPGVKELSKQWAEARSAAEAEDEGDGEDDDDTPGWWYEVEAQREKPGENSPALEVQLENEGTWWLTGIRGADAEGREAMSDLVDHLANDM